MMPLSQSTIIVRGPFIGAQISGVVFLSCAIRLLVVVVSDVYHHRLRHCLVSCLRDGHAPAEVLMRASIAALPSRDTVSAMTSLNSLWSPYVTRSLITSSSRWSTVAPPSLIEVGTSLTLFSRIRRTVKVIKHQVHVRSLFRLQVVNNRLISVNFNLNVSLRLTGKRSGFMKISTWWPSWLLGRYS